MVSLLTKHHDYVKDEFGNFIPHIDPEQVAQLLSMVDPKWQEHILQVEAQLASECGLLFPFDCSQEIN